MVLGGGEENYSIVGPESVDDNATKCAGGKETINQSLDSVICRLHVENEATLMGRGVGLNLGF